MLHNGPLICSLKHQSFIGFTVDLTNDNFLWRSKCFLVFIPLMWPSLNTCNVIPVISLVPEIPAWCLEFTLSSVFKVWSQNRPALAHVPSSECRLSDYISRSGSVLFAVTFFNLTIMKLQDDTSKMNNFFLFVRTKVTVL